jgi:predicted PurR-regulated permease PerM
MKFIQNNYKLIIGICVLAILIHWFITVIQPGVIQQTKELTNKIDSLNNEIKKVEENQKRLDTTLLNYINVINELQTEVSNLEGKKTIIKEIHHEKINRSKSFDNKQIDSFFTDRYK